MKNYIHVDEKWFYLKKTSNKYYLVCEEMEPQQTCKSKRFITKVMFLAAVARPRWDNSRNQWFDGKLPFVKQEPAKRGSKNRPAGTLETKVIESVNKSEYRKMMVNQLLPSIKAKWPRSNSRTRIWIQQDNAKPHFDKNDKDFNEADTLINITCQPPNSPDTNVLDLGFFNAIQALQHQTAPSNIDELIDTVIDAFNNLSRDTLNKVFLSHQQCMIEMMKVNGGNNYKLPHLGKDKLQRVGQLPLCLKCDMELVEATRAKVSI